MKSKALLPKILMLTAGLAIAGSLSAAAASGAPSGAKSTAAQPAKPEPERKIPGFVIPRPNGGFLSLRVEEGRWVLAFYDAKKKPAHVDVARARMRYQVRYKATEERTVLNPNADGTALTSPLFVRPPLNYRIYLSLFVEGNDEDVEHYVEDFRQ